MSGSGSNKITSVLGASTISGVGAVALKSHNASFHWVILTISIALGLALLAIILKLLAVIASKRGR